MSPRPLTAALVAVPFALPFGSPVSAVTVARGCRQLPRDAQVTRTTPVSLLFHRASGSAVRWYACWKATGRVSALGVRDRSGEDARLLRLDAHYAAYAQDSASTHSTRIVLIDLRSARRLQSLAATGRVSALAIGDNASLAWFTSGSFGEMIDAHDGHGALVVDSAPTAGTLQFFGIVGTAVQWVHHPDPTVHHLSLR
jgi:hypothetical protein